MINQLLTAFKQGLIETVATPIPHRHRLLAPLALRWSDAELFPQLAAFETMDEVFADMMIDVNADIVVNSITKSLRQTEWLEQEELTAERVLYPSDRAAIYGKALGLDMAGVNERLGQSVEAGMKLMDDAGVPKVVYNRFNDEGYFYPTVGLSWTALLGTGFHLLNRLFTEQESIFVGSRNRARVTLTNGSQNELRADGQKPYVIFDVPSIGFTLERNNKTLDMTVYYEELELYRAVPFQFTRHALLHRLIAHHLELNVGNITLLVSKPYRLSKVAATSMEEMASNQLHAVLRERNKLSILPSEEREKVGAYLFEDLVFSSNHGNVHILKK